MITEKSKITVVGLGYVGMSLAVLLGSSHNVVAVDIDDGPGRAGE
jgi:UDP-N-acetyl-D-mannosaminuronate dehydrogenase